MTIWIKVLLIVGILVNVVAMMWFLLGSTANFNRSLDLVSTVMLLKVWFPSLILVVIAITILIKGWAPTNYIYLVAVCLIIVTLLYLAVPLFKGVNTQGWLNDNIVSDPLKLTSDGKYEYRLELINLFQRNSRERLFLRDVSTGQEIYISVYINTKDKHGLYVRSGDDWMWAILSPTNDPHQYMLTTTEILRLPEKRFFIDVTRGISTKIE